MRYYRTELKAKMTVAETFYTPPPPPPPRIGKFILQILDPKRWLSSEISDPKHGMHTPVCKHGKYPLWALQRRVALKEKLNGLIVLIDAIILPPPQALLRYVSFSKTPPCPTLKKDRDNRLVRFAYSVAPLGLNKRAPVEEAGHNMYLMI